jgi:signal peptidase I
MDSNDESSVKSHLADFIQFAAVVIAILAILRFFIAEPHRVSGSSMVPNFHDQDYIITNKLATKISTLKRGEVVILKNPRNADQVFIKRIIGLPGETIKLQEGQVYLNNKLLNEPYLPQGLKTPGESFLQEGQSAQIPQNEYFVMGDNRSASSDSREFGPIPVELIIGQAIFRYWPIPKLGIITIDKASI